MTRRALSPRETVAAIATGQIVCWAALYYGFSSFVVPMQASLGWSRQLLMGAFTCGLATWALGSYAVGAAIDRGRGRLVLTLGAALAGVGFILWSRITSVWQLYAVWLLLGASMSMLLYEPAFTILTKRYPHHYRRGITAVTLVGGFASTLSFPAVTWLCAAMGWRDALVVIGVVLLIAVVPLHAWALGGASADVPSTESVPTSVRNGDVTLAAALNGRRFWLLALAFAAYGFAAGAIWAHLMSLLTALGLTPAQAVGIVVWIGPAQVLGRLLHFSFGRSLSPWHLGLALLAVMPLGLLLLAAASHAVAFVAFAIVFGTVNGLITIVRGTIVPMYYGRAEVGRISGLMTSIVLLSMATAPLAAAWMLVSLDGYRQLLLVFAGMSALAFVALMAAGFDATPGGDARQGR
jgi:MFS family permease